MGQQEISLMFITVNLYVIWTSTIQNVLNMDMVMCICCSCIILTSFLILQEFISNEGGGEAPLEGSIPDMTSSTELVSKYLVVGSKI